MEALLRFQNIDAGQEDDSVSREIILARNVSIESYIKYSNSHKPLVKICLAGGNVIAYEVPLGSHAAAAYNAATSMANWHPGLAGDGGQE